MSSKNNTSQFSKNAHNYYKISTICFILAVVVVTLSFILGGKFLDNTSQLIATLIVIGVVIIMLALLTTSLVYLSLGDDYHSYTRESIRVSNSREFWTHKDLCVTITRTVYCKEHSVETTIIKDIPYSEANIKKELEKDIATYIPEGQRAYAIGYKYHGENRYCNDGYKLIEIVDNAVLCIADVGYEFHYTVNGIPYYRYKKTKDS